METKANYATVGAFTLAVLAAVFGFVFWFAGPSKNAASKSYEIVFEGSVSGLSNGAAVLFNGLRVGAVSKLGLNPENPGEVIARIDVDKTTPVKTDTRVRLEFTGLTGMASVALSGGSTDASLLVAENGALPVIHADSSQFQNLVETAQRIAAQADQMVTKLNKLVDENAGTVGSTLRNVQAFSDAIAGSVDPNKVRSIVDNLQVASAKVGPVLDGVNGFLGKGGGETKGVFTDVSDAAHSIKKLADNLDIRTKEIAANINRFAGPGLRQYEALAADGRRTLDDISRAVRSLESNPSQIIFGSKAKVPEVTTTR